MAVGRSASKNGGRLEKFPQKKKTTINSKYKIYLLQPKSPQKSSPPPSPSLYKNQCHSNKTPTKNNIQDASSHALIPAKPRHKLGSPTLVRGSGPIGFECWLRHVGGEGNPSWHFQKSVTSLQRKRGAWSCDCLMQKVKSWKYILQNGSLMVAYHGRICKKDHQTNPRKRVFAFGPKTPCHFNNFASKAVGGSFSKILIEQFLEDNQKTVFFCRLLQVTEKEWSCCLFHSCASVSGRLYFQQYYKLDPKTSYE